MEKQQFPLQLKNVIIDQIEAKKLIDNFNSETHMNIETGITSQPVNEKQVFSFLNLKISVRDKDSSEELFYINTLIKSIFEIVEPIENSSDLANKSALFLVWPYAREIVSSMALKMGIQGVMIPTLDILNSLKNNKGE